MTGLDPSAGQPTPIDDVNKQLERSFVELRAPHIDSSLDSSQAYDDLHDAGHLRQRDSFYLWFLSLLRSKEGETLLDVSCGQGALVHFARQAGLWAYGLDLSPSAVQMARNLSPLAAFAVANAEHLPYADDAFVYVTNIGSVEHYMQPAHAVREMARVLRSDGHALILLPNTFGLLGNIVHVWRTGDVFDDGQPLQRYGTNGQWRQLLETNGLTIERVYKYERAWPRTRKDLAWYFAHPHRIVRPLLSAILPVNLASFLVYLCSKA
jgi:ubiquinone/menaquinone biosynthesis C-methylase UbiE